MNWTKFSDRLPPEDYEAVHIIDASGKSSIGMRHSSLSWAQWIAHVQPTGQWHPITYPELPKEETQLNRDSTEARIALGLRPSIRTLEGQTGFGHGWHAALAWERAENAKDLANVSDMPAGFHVEPHRESVKRLRKRAGLDK